MEQIGDMHWAVVARDELEAEGRATTADLVAIKLGWFRGRRRTDPPEIDVERATTAMLAAAEHGFMGSPR